MVILKLLIVFDGYFPNQSVLNTDHLRFSLVINEVNRFSIFNFIQSNIPSTNKTIME